MCHHCLPGTAPAQPAPPASTYYVPPSRIIGQPAEKSQGDGAAVLRGFDCTGDAAINSLADFLYASENVNIMGDGCTSRSRDTWILRDQITKWHQQYAATPKPVGTLAADGQLTFAQTVALKRIEVELEKNNPAITDTIWMSDTPNETMLEVVQHALASSPASPSS